MAQSFADRLIAQLLLAEQREDELLFETRALAQHAAEKQTVMDKTSAVKQKIVSAEKTRNEVAQANKAMRQRLHDVIDDDDRKRKVLSEELQAKISSVNLFAEECTKTHAQTVHEGAALKEQLAILEQHKASGTDKFQEIVNAREKEIIGMQENLEKELLREPSLRIAVEEQKNVLEATRREHAELKAQVDGYMSKFNDVQQRLSDAKAIYDSAKEERDRMARRLHSSETDRQVAISRAEKSKSEMLIERVKVEELEKQLQLLEKQTAKLQQLYNTLTGSSDLAAGAAVHADPSAAPAE